MTARRPLQRAALAARRWWGRRARTTRPLSGAGRWRAGSTRSVGGWRRSARLPSSGRTTSWAAGGSPARKWSRRCLSSAWCTASAKRASTRCARAPGGLARRRWRGVRWGTGAASVHAGVLRDVHACAWLSSSAGAGPGPGHQPGGQVLAAGLFVHVRAHRPLPGESGVWCCSELLATHSRLTRPVPVGRLVPAGQGRTWRAHPCLVSHQRAPGGRSHQPSAARRLLGLLPLRRRHLPPAHGSGTAAARCAPRWWPQSKPGT